jgi:3-keto-disaccharide hydrolase
MRAIPRSLRWRSGSLLALALAALQAPPARAETLFDGRSLNGWRHAGTATFEVKHRTLRTVPGAGQLGLLYYTRRTYKDFELTLQFRAADHANSGVHLRFPKPGGCSWIDCGYEVQINDTAADPRKTGSIYAFKDLDATQARAQPPNTWSRLRIRVTGQTYTVYRDGVRINHYRGHRRRSGYIGLQAHGGPQDVVAFRAIRVRRL